MSATLLAFRTRKPNRRPAACPPASFYAAVARLSDYQPKHRRPSSPSPTPLFPGSDPMGDPIYAAVAADFRTLGFGPREFSLTFAGFPDRIFSRLESAMAAAGVTAVREASS